MTRMASIVAAANAEQVNSYFEGIGSGPDNHSVPLSPDGSEPATHFGMSLPASQEFLDMMANPTPEQAEILALMVTDTNSDGLSPREHFDAVLSNEGLQQVEIEEAAPL